MNREDIKLKLEDYLTPKRYIHSLNVMNVAIDLAKRYGLDKEKAAIAALLHDCARDYRGEEALRISRELGIEIDPVSLIQPEILHGAIGAEFAKRDFEIKDEGILNAIKYHTTGRENMSLLEKLIFIADYIEPGRNFPGLTEARDLAFRDLNKAVLLSLDRTIKHVLAKGTVIHMDTIRARNYILLNDTKEPIKTGFKNAR